MRDEHTRRRLSFGKIAEAYDRHRPRYPDALIERVARGVGPRSRLLELGCGTGIATLSLAKTGAKILALEPSAPMVEIARRNLAPCSNVQFEETTFENWNDSGQSFDLIYSAQAWHWIDPAAWSARVPALLGATGQLAVFWNSAKKIFQEGQAAYAKHAPENFTDRGPVPSFEETVEKMAAPLRNTFGAVEVLRWPWSKRYTAEEYVALVSTYSDHSTVPEPRRTRLYHALADVVREMGGTVEREYEAVLMLANAASCAGART
jgi:trans-aconitate methyltransferase